MQHEAVRRGGRAGPVQSENGLTLFTVTNAGLTWAIYFYGCEASGCGEVQFSAVVPGAGATLDAVNAWNRDNRYLKAFHAAAETPTATVQYDVVVLSGEGADELFGVHPPREGDVRGPLPGNGVREWHSATIGRGCRRVGRLGVDELGGQSRDLGVDRQ